MERNVDEEFQILADYLAERKKLPVDSDSEDDEEEKWEHEGVETEEDFVCCQCGLVLSSIYQPDVHWHEHAVWIGNTPTRIAS